MAESIERGGGGRDSESNMMISMLSQQMQMQHQILQQQKQMQMAAIEKRAETSE
jgi:hypothetical protein